MISAIFKIAIKEMTSISGVDCEANPKLLSDKGSLFDLVISLVPTLNKEALLVVLKYFSTFLGAKEAYLQKKAYKGLEVLFRLDKAEVAILMQENFSLLQEVFCSNATISSSCKKSRLGFLLETCKIMQPSVFNVVIPLILPEVILSIKEVNEKSRLMAYDLLLLMGLCMKEQGVLSKFYQMISAGFAGSSSYTISATIIALSRIAFEFHKDVTIIACDIIVEKLSRHPIHLSKLQYLCFQLLILRICFWKIW